MIRSSILFAALPLAFACDDAPSGAAPAGDATARLAAAAPVTACGIGAGVIADVGGVSYKDLSAAVTAAGSGGVVTVCPGTWSVSNLRITSDVEIVGASGAAHDTVLDAGGAGRVIDTQGASLRLVDLTLQSGSANRGGAIEADGGALTLEGCRLLDNTASDAGGAIYIDGGALTISGSTFEGNSAGDGGAVSADDLSGELVVRSSTFTANQAGYEGGAITLYGDLRVLASTFTGNVADYGGGAISVYANRDDYRLTVLDSSFEGNYADYEGGAIQAGAGGDQVMEVVIGRSAFTDNSADYEGGAISFGAWGWEQMAITQSTFEGNEAGAEGGAIELGTWGAFDVVISDSALSGNSARGGGAIDARPQGDDASSRLRVVRSALTGNDATTGAAMELGNGGDQPLRVWLTGSQVTQSGGRDAVSSDDEVRFTSLASH